MQISDYDFIDFGASTGGSIEFAQRKLGGSRGLGVDLSAEKVATMRDRGFECLQGDVTSLDLPDKCVRFVTISHVLEHLPDLAVVEGAIDSAIRLATDFVYIQGPWYDANGYLQDLGLKLYWADWSGHTCHVNSQDLRKVIEPRTVVDYFVAGRGLIQDSDHPAVHPLGSPRNQQAYDQVVHLPKPHPAVAFTQPIFEEMVCAIKLRDDLEQWPQVVRARGATTMVVPPRRPVDVAVAQAERPAKPTRGRRAVLGRAATRREAGTQQPSGTRGLPRAAPPAPSAAQQRQLAKVQHRLLHARKWSYLRYLHMREALLLAPDVGSVLSVGASKGMAEVALAIEFPHISFEHVTTSVSAARAYANAEKVALEWQLPNVAFGARDVLRPQLRRHDLVMSCELLDLHDDDARVAAELRAAAHAWVFTLVPFATGGRSRGAGAGAHQGYDVDGLNDLFPGVAAVRGCYWTDAGVRLRARLQELDDSEVLEQAGVLRREAEEDLRDAVPEQRSDALGIWVLSRV